MGAVPELVEACFATEVGKVSQPVKTAKGYHLILVESRSPEGIRPLDEARDDVISRLSYNKRKEITETTLDELKSKYRVSYLSEAERDTKTPEELFKTASESSTPRDKIKYYRQFIERFPDNERVYEAEFMIGFTLAEDLKDYDEAERIFSEFLKRYPDGDLSDDAEWMLENMRTGKEPDFGGE
jgi:tetratricopeptide (TPR) repeat protein